MAYATFNPAAKSAHITLSGSDLVATTDTVAGHYRVFGTKSVSTGKWYAEFTIGILTSYTAVGIGRGSGYSTENYLGSDDTGYSYNSGADCRYNGAYKGGSFTFVEGDVIGVAFDADAHTISWNKNGGAFFTPADAVPTDSWYLATSLYGNVAGSVTINTGASAWAYSPPADHVGWSVPEPTVGDGEVSLQSLTAEGSRIAAGAGTMESLTATGGRLPYGVASLEQLTVSGAGGTRTGAGTMETLTASATGHQAGYGDVTTEELTAEGSGYEIPIADGAGTLRHLSAEGAGTIGSVGTAAVRLERFTAEGHVPPAGAATLSELTATASGVVGTIAHYAAGRLERITAAGTGTVPVISDGDVTLQSMTASASGQAVITGTAAVALRTMRGAATGVTGTTGSAELQIAALTAQATGYPVVTANGTIVMPAAYADGVGHETVTQTFKTWVLNSRNLDLTEYVNYDFNSYAEFNGHKYAANADGIYKLEGTDDAGVDIDAVFKTGSLTEKGSKLLKIPEVLLTVDSGGPLTVTIEKDDATRYTYNTTHVGIDTGIQVRVEPGKGLRGLDYKVEVANNAGEAFSITELNVPLVETGRRLGDR